MKIFTIFALGIIFTFLGQSQVYAQKIDARQKIEEQRKDFQELQKNTNEERQALTEERKDLVSERAEIKNQVNAEIQEQKNELTERLLNATTDQERTEIREEAKVLQANIKEDAENKREEFKTKAREILKGRLGFIFKKFNAFIDRANNIGLRINEKLSSLNESGINVDKEKDLYETAKSLLNSAKDNVANANSVYQSIDTETMDREEIKVRLTEIKTLLKSAREDIKTGYQTLRDIIKSLRENLKQNQPNLDKEPENDTDTPIVDPIDGDVVNIEQ